MEVAYECEMSSAKRSNPTTCKTPTMRFAEIVRTKASVKRKLR